MADSLNLDQMLFLFSKVGVEYFIQVSGFLMGTGRWCFTHSDET